MRGFLLAVLDYCKKQGVLGKLMKPFSTGGRKRVFVSTRAQHNDGRSFITPLEYPADEGPIFLEINVDRPRAIKQAKALLSHLGLECK